jgi:hypothetical protein
MPIEVRDAEHDIARDEDAAIRAIFDEEIEVELTARPRRRVATRGIDRVEQPQIGWNLPRTTGTKVEYYGTPFSKDQEVTLVDGTKCKMSDAVLAYNTGEYYAKDDKRIIKDILTTMTIVLNESTKNRLRKVYNKIDAKGKLYDFAYTAVDELLNCDRYKVLPIIAGTAKAFAHPSLLENQTFNDKYKEDMYTGRFLRVSKNSLPEFKKKLKFKYREYKGEFGQFLEFIKNKPKTFIKTKGQKYTFGVEIETCSGFLPAHLDHFLYYSAVKDGSLRDEDDNQLYGGEYVTDLLVADLGLKQLKRLTTELSKRCLVNKKCSVHIHLGGVNFTKENIVLMYYLYQQIQEEILLMMPPSRRNNEYCRYLPEWKIELQHIMTDRVYWIDQYYNEIVTILAKRQAGDARVNKKKDHPAGPKCGYNHSYARYCWVNFIPAVFDTRHNGSYTIEFRPMSATTDYNKIKQWLLICMAMVSVVENHKQLIYSGKRLTLTDIVNAVYPKDNCRIIEFIDTRKAKFNSESLVEQEEFSEVGADDSLSIASL